MHTGGARYHMRIEINFVNSFDTSILYLREYKHIILGWRRDTIKINDVPRARWHGIESRKGCNPHTKTRAYSDSYPINVVSFDLRVKLPEHKPNQQLPSISDFKKELSFLSVNPKTCMSHSFYPGTPLFYIHMRRQFLWRQWELLY